MFFFLVAILDMNISQFLKSLCLEHLRDIFEREQVMSVPSFQIIAESQCQLTSAPTFFPEEKLLPIKVMEMRWHLWPWNDFPSLHSVSASDLLFPSDPSHSRALWDYSPSLWVWERCRVMGPTFLPLLLINTVLPLSLTLSSWFCCSSGFSDMSGYGRAAGLDRHAVPEPPLICT